MRYFALATDYDGTLAAHGQVTEETLAALERLRSTGRVLLMVTGRRLDDLRTVFPHLNLFARVIAENGALVSNPATGEETLLGEPPPESFIECLKARGVPVATGKVIVASWEPHQSAILEAIREEGLEHQVIFNKGAVMVLPPGVNKRSGLRLALKQLGISPHNVVAAGDAENDQALLASCECGVAVANALPSLKARADYVTAADRGAGVEELIGHLVRDDLRALETRLSRHEIFLGDHAQGRLCVKPHGMNVLVAGPSGSGKSTLVSGFIERLADARYQYCLLDPEGDYEGVANALTLGNAQHPPVMDEVMAALSRTEQNVVLNLLAVPLTDRPGFFGSVLPRILELRLTVGRPHWLIIDEAHHLLSDTADAPLFAVREPGGILLVTVHPEHVSPAVLSTVQLVIAVGREPERTFTAFSRAVAIAPPLQGERPGASPAWAWLPAEGPPIGFVPVPTRMERRRHMRKYAVGELPPERNFVFSGPEGRLNLHAQNLQTFLRMGEGVDDDTWLHHLRRGHYSAWFREAIKDQALAESAARVEGDESVSATESRRAIRKAIDERYTAAA